jgi:hypothetical protein
MERIYDARSEMLHGSRLFGGETDDDLAFLAVNLAQNAIGRVVLDKELFQVFSGDEEGVRKLLDEVDPERR